MRYMHFEVRKLFGSWKFWAAVLLNYFMCWGAFALKSARSVLSYGGTLNVFIWSVIDNKLVVLVAPIAAVIGYTTSMCDDMDSGSIKNLLLCINRRNYFTVKLLCGIISGMLPVLIGVGGYFATLLLTHPGASIKFNHYTGYVRFFYDRSMLLFSFMYIFHISICSAMMSLLGMGVASWIRNRYMGIVIPIAMQFLLLFAGWIAVIPELAKVLYIFIPSSLYKYLFEPLGQTIYDYVITTACAILFTALAWRKWRTGAGIID